MKTDPTSAAEAAANSIIESLARDISDRRGLKHEWAKIDDDVIAKEILPAWRAIIVQHFTTTTTTRIANFIAANSCQTREGNPVRIFTLEALMQVTPIIGEYLADGAWALCRWRADGSWRHDGSEYRLDLVPLASEAERLREALKNLVSRLEQVHEDGAYQGVWSHWQSHYGPYQGLQYTAEFKAAQAALSREEGGS